MKKILIFALLICMVSALLAIPKWYSSARSTYTSGEWILGLGSGKSADDALSNAKTDLVQQISVKVQSTTEIQAKSIETEGKEFYSESIQKATKMTVDHSIQGMKVENQEKEKNTYYVLVTLSKNGMLTSLKGELDKLSSSINGLMNDAKSLIDNGKIIPAIKNYTDAQAIIPEFYTKKALYDSFADKPYLISDNATVNRIDSNIRTLLASVRFDVVSGNQQTAKKGTMLPEPIVFKAIMRNAGMDEIIPISSAPVKVIYPDGQLIEKGLTDNEGKFSVNIMATPMQGERGKVQIKMDNFTLPPYFNASFNAISCEAYYKTSESGQVVTQVNVIDSKNTRQDKAERRLIKVLNDNNVQVNNISPLLMKGTLSVKEVKQVDGVGPTQYLALVEMDIQFMIIRTNEILGTITANGRGLSTKSESEAIIKAYENINVNARDLKQMLSASDPKIQDALMRAVASEPVVIEKVVEKPVYVDRVVEKQVVVEKPVYVEKQTVVETPPTTTPANTQTKDIHGFGPNDYIYCNEAFTNEDREMWGRVGELVTPATSTTKGEAEFFDHEDGIKVWSAFYYSTKPADISNIKRGDVVFVFHNGDKPEDERDAKTNGWKLVRVTNLDNYYKGTIGINCWPNNPPLNAIRVKK